MGLRFRKSVKICKGVKVNFSKSGVSLSIGGRGHSLNIGKNGTRATVGIPGTGLSYSTKLFDHPKSKTSSKSKAQSPEAQPRENPDEVYNAAKAENERFIYIHRLSPLVDKEDYYIRVLNSLEAPQNENAANDGINTEAVADRKFLQDLFNGDENAVSEAVESWISSCELPVEINVNYEWRANDHLMYLDVDLPEIEDLPRDEIVRSSSGNLKEKKKTQATLKEEYVDLVFGLAIFISANIFNVSPAIHKILISGYTQRRNKEGDITAQYVYSIKFTRDIFESSDLTVVNPREFCMRFENRCNITTGMLMKKIEPYTCF